MKTKIAAGILAGSLMMAPGAARAMEVVKTDNASVDVGAQLQVMGFGQYLSDTQRNDARAYLFLKTSRLSLGTDYSGFKFRLLVGLGGEDEIKAPSPGMALGLLDLYMDAPTVKNTYVRVGQFRVPYSREELMNPTDLLFAGTSLNNTGFKLGRDVGAAIHTRQGGFAGGAGVFTGGGRDVPQRYLPENLGIPLLAGRFGWTNDPATNVFAENEKRLVDHTMYGVFASGTYTKDSQVGHSTVLNTKQSERSLMINTNWNPYLNTTPIHLARQWQVGGDAEVRTPVGPGTLAAELEGNFSVFQNLIGRIAMPGGRAQVSYSTEHWDVALRYGLLVPDAKFMNGNQQITGNKGIQELTPAIAYKLSRFNAKILADLPIHINTPVVTEPGIGAYDLMDMPDQASVMSGKKVPIARQDVVEGRLMLQAVF